MPRGKLVSKTELQRSAPKPAAKRGRPPKAVTQSVRKQAIAKVSSPARVPKVKAEPRPHQPSISITVQIPSLRRPKEAAAVQKQTKTAWWRKRVVITAATIMLVAIAAGLVYVLPAKKSLPQPGATAEAAARTAPDYKPLVLADQKPTSESYDGRRNMVSFKTSFSGIRITVSEQSLPPNFTKDPTALLRAADSLNAKQRIDTARGPVFIATNDTAGDQMGIFADTQVLGFIHTDHKMDDVSWKSFVEQLKSVDWQNSNQNSGI